MPRSLRFQFPGAFYHVMARGNARGKIFLQDTDRALFLRSLGEACGRTGWRIHAWVLIPNHYHLLVETPEANLVPGMQWLQNAYTRRFNTRHRHWGRLFGDRYKAVPVEGRGYYHETLLDYIHLNPARAGLLEIEKAGSVLDYPWSSVAGGYALPMRRRPCWMAADEGLAVFDLPDTASGRRRFVQRLDRRAAEEPPAQRGVPLAARGADRRQSGTDLRRGWYWGSQAFAERLLALGERALAGASGRQARSTPEKRAHGEAEARRLLAEGLARAGLSSAELSASAGSEPKKVAIAQEIWEKTSVSLSWIAKHLSMRSAANASQQMRRQRQTLDRP